MVLFTAILAPIGLVVLYLGYMGVFQQRTWGKSHMLEGSGAVLQGIFYLVLGALFLVIGILGLLGMNGIGFPA